MSSYASAAGVALARIIAVDPDLDKRWIDVHDMCRPRLLII
jgi:hypothetical protein